MLIEAAVQNISQERLIIEKVELAPPRKGEILVRIVSCGICHTDEAQRHGGGVYPVDFAVPASLENLMIASISAIFLMVFVLMGLHQ